MPLGYSFSNDQDNTGILKIISPNMLRVGRNNSRALSGPMKLPRGGELLDKSSGYVQYLVPDMV